MVNPSFELREKNYRLKGIVPVYGLRGTLTQKALRDAIRDALQKVPVVTAIPPELIRKYALPSLSEAYRKIHAPEALSDRDEAAERIALEEYFILISAFRFMKGGKEDARVFHYSATARETAEFAARFPFTFTDGQKRAVDDIYENLKSPKRMNRLLQGDVGSGKTAVALCGIYMAAKAVTRRRFWLRQKFWRRRTMRSCRNICPNSGRRFWREARPQRKNGKLKKR